MPLQSALAEHERAKATYQDVLDAPPHMVAEVLEGKLYMNPRPTFEHGTATFTLLRRLAAPYQDRIEGPGGWQFIHEPEIHFDDHVLVPDGAAWCDGNLPNGMTGPHTSIPPDWACKTLSPSTRKMDRTKKRDIYARFGVKHLWFVDPDRRSLEAFSLRNGRFHEVGSRHGKERVALPPFKDAGFSLNDLWLGYPA